VSDKQWTNRQTRDGGKHSVAWVIILTDFVTLVIQVEQTVGCVCLCVWTITFEANDLLTLVFGMPFQLHTVYVKVER